MKESEKYRPPTSFPSLEPIPLKSSVVPLVEWAPRPSTPHKPTASPKSAAKPVEYPEEAEDIEHIPLSKPKSEGKKPKSEEKEGLVPLSESPKPPRRSKPLRSPDVEPPPEHNDTAAYSVPAYLPTTASADDDVASGRAIAVGFLDDCLLFEDSYGDLRVRPDTVRRYTDDYGEWMLKPFPKVDDLVVDPSYGECRDVFTNLRPLWRMRGFKTVRTLSGISTLAALTPKAGRPNVDANNMSNDDFFLQYYDDDEGYTWGDEEDYTWGDEEDYIWEDEEGFAESTEDIEEGFAESTEGIEEGFAESTEGIEEGFAESTEDIEEGFAESTEGIEEGFAESTEAVDEDFAAIGEVSVQEEEESDSSGKGGNKYAGYAMEKKILKAIGLKDKYILQRDFVTETWASKDKEAKRAVAYNAMISNTVVQVCHSGSPAYHDTRHGS